MKHCWIILLSLLTLTNLNKVCGQVSVSGTVMDSMQKPVASATVTLFKKTRAVIISYAITDAKGYYQIKSNTVSVNDTLLVQAFALGYSRRSVAIQKPVQVTDFSLPISTNSLPEVTVTNKKIMLKLEGDTISYDVSAFANPQDRVIGDIIKKLPGVEVDDNGKITYNGKDINRFYIDGENLLDGKYNIATRSIPSDMVDKVQVLENHQPIKSLKNVLPSNDPAMNIVLKDKARLKPIGQGDAAAGTPDVYSGNVNVMLFQKKVQFINYFKLNNTGTDLNYDMISHFNGGQDNIPAPLMSIGIGSAPLSKKRWLFNNSGIINVNNMVKLKNDFQLRINASYLFDKEYQTTGSSVSYFTPTDTIHYVENQNNRSIVNTFRTQFTLTANKTAYYLNDVLLLENTPQQVAGSLQASGSNDINQQLSGTVTNLSNELNYTKVLPGNKNVVEGYAYINQVRNPATLMVTPGLNPSVFNNSIPYAALIQDASVPTFFTNNYLSYKTPGKFRQSYKAGFNFQQQQLNSALASQQLNGNKAAVADSFINNLQWKRLKIYGQADYGFVTKKIELVVSIPVTYMSTNYSGRLFQKQATNLPVTPYVTLKFNSGKESYFTARYAYSDNWGDIKNVYDGYVMQNYRNFLANVPFLPETNVQNASVGYYFKNTLKIFFFNINASYSASNANSIAANTFTSVLQQSKNIPFINISESKSVSGSISKYIFPLQSTIGAKFAWQLSTTNQLLNGVLLPYRNNMFSFGTNLNSKINSWWNISYTNTFSKYTNQPNDEGHGGNAQVQEVITSQHTMEMNFSVQKNIYLKLNGEYYFSHYTDTKDNQSLFADATCTYKWNKLKTDIELSVNNIAGTDHYTNVSATSNIISAYTYQIRPRMVLLKFLFRF